MPSRLRSFGATTATSRMGVAERDHPLERVADEPGVGVEDQHPAARRDLLEAARPAGGEAAVRLLEHPHGGEPLAHERDGVVARVVVDDDGLDALDALEALLDPGQGVVGRDDDAPPRQPCPTSGRAPPRTDSQSRITPRRAARARP